MKGKIIKPRKPAALAAAVLMAAELIMFAMPVAAEENIPQSGGGTISDMTQYQWEHNNSADTLPRGEAYKDGFQVNIPDWNTDVENAVGVVAVLDTGMDISNPDLQSVVINNATKYNAEGGDNGFNVLGPDRANMFDTFGHGTHVAGTIGAAWNGFGTSGVANGIKILPIRICDENGEETLEDVRTAYRYLSKAVDNGLNLVAVNNSWGDRELYGELSELVTELGEKGVVSVFSSGNESEDTDTLPRMASALKDNPYAIVVNASARDGDANGTSNWGDGTTDLYAPGKKIFSTFSKDSSRRTYMSDLDSMATRPDISYVKNGKELLSSFSCDIQEIRPTETVYDFDGDGKAYRMEVTDVMQYESEIEEIEGAPFVSKSWNIYLKIPVSDLTEDTWLSFRYYIQKEDPCPTVKVLGAVQDSSGTWSWQTMLPHPWDMIMSGGNKWYSYSTCIGNLTPKDNYVYICFKAQKEDALQDAVVWLDCLGYGKKDNAACYDYASGTSMATPIVTGAAAVVAKAQGLPAGTDRDNTVRDYAALARERVRILKGCTTPDEKLSHCTSGGQLDLSLLGTVGQYTPVVESASAQGRTVTITGAWFGDTAGNVKLNGQTASVQSWNKSTVTVTAPESLNAGVITVSVTAGNGKTGKGIFEMEFPGGTSLFESSIAVPEQWKSSSMASHIIGLGGKIYVMVQDQTNISRNTDEAFSDKSRDMPYHDLWCYDPAADRWMQCASLSESKEVVSLTLWDGRLLMLATRDNAATLLTYNPESNSWTNLEISNMPFDAGIINVNGRLLLVGGSTLNEYGQRTPADSIYELDINAKTLTKLAEKLPEAQSQPQLLAVGDTLYVAQNNDAEYVTPCLYRITLNENRVTCENMTEKLPAGTISFAMAATAEGLIITGVNGAGADCWLLQNDAFTPYVKQLSRGPLHYPAALGYGGRLYGMGSTIFASGQTILRSTDVKTDMPAGDRESAVNDETDDDSDDETDDKPEVPTQAPTVPTETQPATQTPTQPVTSEAQSPSESATQASTESATESATQAAEEPTKAPQGNYTSDSEGTMTTETASADKPTDKTVTTQVPTMTVPQTKEAAVSATQGNTAAGTGSGNKTGIPWLPIAIAVPVVGGVGVFIYFRRRK